MNSDTGAGSRVFLGLVIHNHQPVGNFPWVFAQAYERAYLPMVQALERHPAIRLSIHYSGPLLDWLKPNQPALLERISTLAEHKQIEIVGGAYYEPILPSIPDSDRVGQIRMMSDFCLQRFGSRPEGLWLAERVWEPSLPTQLAQAGVGWTVVDDTHFKMVGLDDDDLFGYYVTEDQGYPLRVFGTSKFLRYSVPFKPVEDVLAYLRSHASADAPRIALMGDDGEKFGVWPKTYEHCWGKNGWIERFFTEIEKNAAWLTTVPAGEFVRMFPPAGRIYLPCASYDEMMEWALPASRSRELSQLKHSMEAEGKTNISGYTQGAFWRNFSVKYPEANWMHKKMLRVHEKVRKAMAVSGMRAGQDELWQGQCNCPYWHGVFGGLYLADIRAATYHHLIEAEKQADAAVHKGKAWLNCEQDDIDLDGNQEVLVDGSAFGLCISPRQGGSIVEWDLHRPSFNVLASLARRPEPYHRDIAEAIAQSSGGTETIHVGIRLKDSRAAHLLTYDQHPRFSLIDHFVGPEIDLHRFAAADYTDLGDFAGKPYEDSFDLPGKKASIVLSRRSFVTHSDRHVPLTLRKTLHLQAGVETLDIEYQITNDDDQPVSGILAVEWNINLLGGNHNDQAYYEIPGVQLSDAHLDSWGADSGVSKVYLGNRYLGIRLMLSVAPSCDLWRFPVETVSNSEDGIEGLYQASCLVIRLPFILLPGKETRLQMTWRQA